MSSAEYADFDAITSQADLQPGDDSMEDIQTTELMQEAVCVSTSLASGDFASEEKTTFLLNMMHEKWKEYVGRKVTVMGQVFAAHEEQVIPLDSSTRTEGIFQGFGTEYVIDENGPHRILSYEFTAGEPDEDDEEIDLTSVRFFATTEAHLEFPDIISIRKLNALVAPLLERVDEVMMSPDIESVSDIIHGLQQLDLYHDIEPEHFEIVYSALVEYLNEVSGITDLSAIVTEVDGITYRRSDHEPMETTGRATIVEPSFYIGQPFPCVPELCIVGTMSQRGRHSTVEGRIVPLDVMSNLDEIARPQE